MQEVLEPFVVDVAQHLEPPLVRPRVLGHDVLDRVRAGGEVPLVLGVVAVFQAREQVEGAAEVVGIAGAEVVRELRVRREAPGRASLVQQERLECLHVARPLVLLHAVEASDERREELLEAVGRAVADRSAEEVALHGGEHGEEALPAERVAAHVVEHGHEERVHDRDVEAPDTLEEPRDIEVVGPAARDVGVVAGEAPELLEEVLDGNGSPVALGFEVALECLVDVAPRERLRSVEHGEPVSHELVEDRVVGGRAECHLDGAPVRLVELVLPGVAHEHEVANEVGRGEVLSRGVHGLEDELRVVLALGERDRDHLEPLDACPDHVRVVDAGDEPLEEPQVVQQALGSLVDLDVGVLEVVLERTQGGPVALRERELVVVVARLVLVDEVAAPHDLLEGERERALRVRLRVPRERDDEQCDGGDALLAVDEHERGDTARRHRAMLDPHNRASEVRCPCASANSEDVLPELVAVVLVPGVRPLEHRDDEARPGTRHELDYPAW